MTLSHFGVRGHSVGGVFLLDGRSKGLVDQRIFSVPSCVATSNWVPKVQVWRRESMLGWRIKSPLIAAFTSL